MAKTNTDTLLTIVRDIGEIKSSVSALHEKIDHQPSIIELCINKHEEACRESKQYVTTQELPEKICASNTIKLTKIKSILIGLKEVAVIAIAVITGKIM